MSVGVEQRGRKGVIHVGQKCVGIADRQFFVIPNDEEKTLTVCPTEEQYSAIELDKEKARILANIILHQIQKW